MLNNRLIYAVRALVSWGIMVYLHRSVSVHAVHRNFLLNEMLYCVAKANSLKFVLKSEQEEAVMVS